MGKLRINSNTGGIIEVYVYVDRTNKFITLILSFLCLFCLVFPLSIIFIDDLTIGIGFLITLIVFWGSFVFFFRKLMWNNFGKEIYRIEKSKFHYFYDYRVFKDNFNSISYKKIEVGYRKTPIPKNLNLKSEKKVDADPICFLDFILDDSIISSNISVNYKHIHELSNLIKKLNCNISGDLES